MNRQTFFTFGGALLASSALTGGAMAGNVGTIDATGTGQAAAAAAFSTTIIKVANTIFSTTVATADALTVGSQKNFAIQFCPTCNVSGGVTFSVTANVTGATPTNVTTANTYLLQRVAGATALSTVASGAVVTAACTNAVAISNTIYVSGCLLSTGGTNKIGGIAFSGLQFTSANGLATVGGTIGLNGSIVTTNPSGITIDTFSGTIVTSATPLTATITASTTATASALSTPSAFTYLTAVQAGQSVFTMALATVNITRVASVLGMTLGAAVTTTDVISSVHVTVQSGVLSSAVKGANVIVGDGGADLLAIVTPAAFSSNNTLTFALASANVATLFSIQVVFDGTTQVPASLTAGSVTLKYGSQNAAGPGQIAATAPAVGATAKLERSGFSGEVNSLYSTAISKLTTPAYNSYVRIHNNGLIAGAATITVIHDATGVTAGSFTTTAIAAGSTATISAADLEAGAGITTSQIELYTVKVTGPFLGYIQHVVYNPTTGQINDLSAFRNAGSTVSVP